MIKYISLIFLTAIVLAGCAKTNEEYNTLRNSKVSSIKTFATMLTSTIEEDKQHEVSLGDDDKEVIDLDDQKVFASKLILPKMTTPFSLDISSSSSVGFFAPKIFFLDEKNQIVRTVEAKNLQFDRGWYKGTIFINSEYSKINSIIITQDTKEINSKKDVKYVNTPVTVAVTIGFIPIIISADKGDQNKQFENAYGGKVNITLKSYKPAILGSK